MRKYLSVFVLVLSPILVFIGCSKKEAKLFALKDASETGLFFQNTLDDKTGFNILNYVNYYNGGGVGIGDFDNNGLQDIFFTANLEDNKLYLNQGDLEFKDITDEAKVKGTSDWTTGVSVVDVNGDGWMDIYVSSLGGNFEGIKSINELLINNGPSEETGQISFTESAKEYGLDVSAYSTQAAFLDYDNDGDLDMYLLNHAFHSVDSYAPREVMLTRTNTILGDKLYRNELDKGLNKFIDVTSSSGILSTPIGFGLGITCSDINQDGWIDIYISNDFHENDYLLINQKDGTFSDDLSKWIGHTSKYSMGNDIADYNNDGLVDIITMDMLPNDPSILQKSMAEDDYDLRNIILRNGYHSQLARNCLQLNMGGKFSEIAPLAGVEASDWSWAPLLADFDNDGLKDLYISNGIYRRPNDLDYLDYTSDKAVKSVMGMKVETISKKLIEAMPQNPISNIGYKNSGELEFSDNTDTWGLNVPSHSNGAAYADLDNDGDLELVLNNINEPAFLFKNQTREQFIDDSSYLQIRFKGNTANTTGVGTKAIIKHLGKIYYQEQTPTRGFMSSMAHEVHFGLGKLKKVDSLLIVWPGGAYQVLKNVPTNQKVEVDQDDASGDYYAKKSGIEETKRIFTVENIDGIAYEHIENTFHDIHREFLIPRKISTEGPGMAVGDVNNDGLEDLFFTNAHNEAAKMFLQQNDATFKSVNIDLFNEDLSFEGVDASFFDVDNDRDLDLFVVSAGSEYKEGEVFLEDRLYINDGKGNFEKSKDLIPQAYYNSSCAKPQDYDNDGDIDIFIGSRVVAGKYGLSPKSRLLKNDGHGKFEEVPVSKELSEAGMVTDAVWADINNDGWQDLIVVGEWMQITIYINKNGVLRQSPALEHTTGWWNTILADDFDNDGDIDLVAGNVGLNTKLDASQEEPVRLYIKDFDSNGSLDPILSCYVQGEEYPFATKSTLNEQLVYLKKQYPSYTSYAGTTIEKLFDSDQLQGTIIKEAVEFRSMFFENTGNGVFKAIPLPIEANFAPIMSMVVRDLNKDGLKDLVIGGNFYGFMPGMGRQDASHGLLLVNKGNNEFEPIDHKVSGILINGQIRNMDWVNLADGTVALIVAKNNEQAILLKTR